MLKKEDLMVLFYIRALERIDILQLDDERLSDLVIDLKEETWMTQGCNDFIKIGEGCHIDREKQFFVVGVYDKTNKEHYKFVTMITERIAEASMDVDLASMLASCD